MTDNIFSSIDTKDKAFWFGYIFSKGYLSKESVNSTLRVFFPVSKIRSLYQLSRFLDSDAEIQHADEGSKYHRVYIVIRSLPLVRDLKNKGCHVYKKDRTCPYSISEELTKDFIAGYMTADSEVSEHGILIYGTLGLLMWLRTKVLILDNPVQVKDDRYVLSIQTTQGMSLLLTYLHS